MIRRQPVCKRRIDTPVEIDNESAKDPPAIVPPSQNHSKKQSPDFTLVTCPIPERRRHAPPSGVAAQVRLRKIKERARIFPMQRWLSLWLPLAAARDALWGCLGAGFRNYCEGSDTELALRPTYSRARDKRQGKEKGRPARAPLNSSCSHGNFLIGSLYQAQ